MFAVLFACVGMSGSETLVREALIATLLCGVCCTHSLQHVVRRLEHPNVCGYMGVCIAAPRFSLVYEFLEHGSLADRLHDTGLCGGLTMGGSFSLMDSGREDGGGGGGGGGGGAGDLFPLGHSALLKIAEDVAEGMRYLHQVMSVLLCIACICGSGRCCT